MANAFFLVWPEVTFEKALINPLARYMSENKVLSDATITVHNIKENELFELECR